MNPNDNHPAATDSYDAGIADGDAPLSCAQTDVNQARREKGFLPLSYTAEPSPYEMGESLYTSNRLRAMSTASTAEREFYQQRYEETSFQPLSSSAFNSFVTNVFTLLTTDYASANSTRLGRVACPSRQKADALQDRAMQILRRNKRMQVATNLYH